MWCELGIWQYVESKGMTMVMMAQSIRYRKELLLFQTYEIRSRIACINDSEGCFYIEVFFVRNNFVHAIQWTKYRAVALHSKKSNSLDNSSLPSDILRSLGLDVEAVSVIPADMAAWMDSNSISSKKLNPKKT